MVDATTAQELEDRRKRQIAFDENRIREDQAKRDEEDAEREKKRDAERDAAEKEHIQKLEEDLKRDPRDEEIERKKAEREEREKAERENGGSFRDAAAGKRPGEDRAGRLFGGAGNDSISGASGNDTVQSAGARELRPGQSGYLGSQPGQVGGGDGVIRDGNNNIISPAVTGEAGNAATRAPDGRTSPTTSGVTSAAPVDPATTVGYPKGGPEYFGKDAISSAQGFNATAGGDPDNGAPQPKGTDVYHPTDSVGGAR